MQELKVDRMMCAKVNGDVVESRSSPTCSQKSTENSSRQFLSDFYAEIEVLSMKG